MQFLPLRIFALAMAVAVGLTACAASTKIVNQWVSPDYTSPRFKKIMVIGVSKQSSIRRTFEDEFVTQLKTAGVEAVPSYLYIPEDGQVDESRLQAAVKQAGADAVIITRLVRVEKKTEVSPGFYQPAPALSYGFYRGYSAAWLGYYEPPRVYQYDVYIIGDQSVRHGQKSAGVDRHGGDHCAGRYQQRDPTLRGYRDRRAQNQESPGSVEDWSDGVME